MARNHKLLTVEQHRPRSKKKISFNPNLPTQLDDLDSASEGMSLWKKMLAIICMGIAGWFGYMGYLETRVNSPFDGPKAVIKTGLDVPERYWGSYRPGVYFGMKTRDPNSLVTGLMWYLPSKLRDDGNGIRHWCEQGDNLDHYTWTEHDGKTFGVQEIVDGTVLLTTSFVKQQGGNHGGDWTARISVNTHDNRTRGAQISLVMYTALEDNKHGWIRPTTTGKHRLNTGVVGETDGLGTFSLKILNTAGIVVRESFLSTTHNGLHVLRETVLSSLQMVTDKNKKHIVLGGEMLPKLANGEKPLPTFIATQVTGTIPFTVDVVFESGSFMDRVDTLTGKLYTEELKERRDNFHHEIEDKFKLESKGFNDEQIEFAKAAFSNLVGGIGYFYGTSRVQSPYTHNSPVPYWKGALYTSVPSRSFFPRGFLWDEGFHGLLISAWDIDIELDIMSHWFDLMNVEGWIPREQILGQEALSKVPEEFVTQKNTNANPPTFFLTLQFMLQNYANKLPELAGRLSTLERMYPRLQKWFDWFNVTQAGDLPGTYRWQGRDSMTTREINPKTLTSGLDDYPRASHPNMDERHVDLRCWIALSSSILAELAKLLQRDSRKYTSTLLYLSDNKLLDSLHWSPRSESYTDYGLHTDAVALQRPPAPKHPTPGRPPQNTDKVRVVLQDPELRFVDSTFGYVSLFPFLLQLVEPDSPKLGKLLDDIKSPNLIWTNYGLRSLAKTSPLYMKHNTEHDPPYWRGYIWMNINYLAVRSLNYYSKIDGPYKNKARDIYKELRHNLITNIFKEYRRTGYIWENYSDKTGEGHGCRPFTGWSSLVVLLMAELY